MDGQAHGGPGRIEKAQRRSGERTDGTCVGID